MMIATQQKPQTKPDPTVEAFERTAKHSTESEPDWLLPIRQEGFQQFTKIGYPTLLDEDWRFTNLGPLVRIPFQLPPSSTLESGTADLVKNATFAQLTGSRLVFVDGSYCAPLSKIAAPCDGLRVEPLSKGLQTEPDLIHRHLATSNLTIDNVFAHLNTAFFQDGAFIHVPAKVQVADPIHLLFITTGNASRSSTHLRNLVIAEPGSRLTITENYFSLNGSSYVTNSFTDFIVGDSAFVEHIKFQDESMDAFHLATLHSTLGRDSKYISHSFALGGRLSRNTIRSKLNGPGLECVFNGLYLTRKDQVADHHMVINHTQPNCASHEYFNGILDDQSKGVFHGRILVQPEAQKTDAKQTNKNILLSDSATVDTKPQLEIYADDVKCTHGATVGQLNEDSIFYLRSRGIGQETARRILIHSFAGEIIDRVECKPAREELNQIVWNRLEQNPHLSEAKSQPLDP